MKRATLLLEPWAGASSEIVAGIGDFLRLHRNWVVQRRDASPDNWDRVLAFRPDGVIASVQNQQMEEQLLAMKVPVVNVYGYFPTGTFPRVVFDAPAAGRMFTDHLYGQGHRNIAVVGGLGIANIQGIHAKVRERANALSVPLHLFNLSNLGKFPYAERSARLREWMRTLDLPVGIITGFAEDAENVAQRCHQLGLDIPEKVSIVTLNDDQIAASLAYPEFTTVDIPWRLMGFAAARMLDRKMEGREQPRQKNADACIEPSGLSLRRSSDAIAVADPDLAKAVAFIRENSARVVSVTEVASAAGISRRLLERRFASAIGHSPFEEIRQQQLARVKTLLLHSEQSIEEMIPHTAFASASHLSNAFKKAFGLSPGQFRRKFRQG